MAMKYETFIIYCILIYQVSGEGLTDEIYDDLNGAFCFKRLTATGEYGCTSSQWGNIGVVHFIWDKEDVQWLLNVADAGPYVPIIPVKFFKNETLIKLKDSGKVSGMIIIPNTTTEAFSPDDSCPNRNCGLKDTCDMSQWNPAGNSLLFVNWGFPIFFINDLQMIEKIDSCYTMFNNDRRNQSKRSLCAVELSSHMLGAVDTQTCIRRSRLEGALRQTFCDPLGDYNIYQILRPASLVEQADRSVVLLIARHDSLSLFDNFVPGAMSAVTSVVTFLLAANYLKDMGVENLKTDKNLVFILLNGESFDFIGSSRVVYDMTKGNFPTPDMSLNLSKIELVIELDQISGDTIYYHEFNPTSNNFYTVVSDSFKNSGISLKRASRSIPPTSSQRFLKYDKEIASVVLSNYDASFVNKYYNSMFDTSSNIEYVYNNGLPPSSNTVQDQLDKIGRSVALTLYRILSNTEYTDPLDSRSQLADELLHCYLESVNCNVFLNATNNTRQPSDTAHPLYVGVDEVNNTLTKKTGLTLAWLTGERLNLNETACLNTSKIGKTTIWATDGCILTSVNYHIAQSPAFVIENYDWLSNEFSSWTESRWQQYMGIRIFLKPSFHHEIFSLCMGLFVLIVSFVVVFIINKNSAILFNNWYVNTVLPYWLKVDGKQLSVDQKNKNF